MVRRAGTVDIGPADADYWMAQHGAEYGLCQIYANEVWHYERVIEPGGSARRSAPTRPPGSRPSRWRDRSSRHSHRPSIARFDTSAVAQGSSQIAARRRETR